MKKPKYIPEFSDIPSGRRKMPELPVEERRGNFKEVELGFTEEMVLKEAARCLSCRRCIGCGLCLAECDQEAVVYDEKASEMTLEGDAIIFAPDAEIYNPDRKPELGYCDSANVITSMEFERLVSATGPFGGMLLRPFDGELPRRIAFIQCVGSRDEGIGANYCSTVCCSRTLSQARRAKALLGEVKVKVFHRGLRPIGKGSELDLRDIQAADWMELVEAAVSGVEEDRDTGTVSLAYSANGEQAREEFDLVVLAVGIQSSRQFKRYARAGGAKVDKFGFVDRGLGSLLADQDQAAFAGTITGPGSSESSLVEAMAAASRVMEGLTESKSDTTSPAGGSPMVYACEYGLGLAGMDLSVLERLKAQGVAVRGVYPFLCYKDGRADLAAKRGEAAGLVVMGCHRGGYEELFARILGLPAGRVEILGKPELEGEPAGAFSEALKRLSAQSGTQPAPSRPARVIVVGGGTSGLAAMGELLRRGLEAVLVEKSPEVGKSLTDAALDAGVDIEVAENFVRRVTGDSGAKVLVSSQLTSVLPSLGKLVVGISTPEAEQTLEAGALLLATGAGSYVPRGYAYAKGTAVTDQLEFRDRIGKGEEVGKKVIMIQCVGARDEDHPYCSRFCCAQAIANALLCKSNRPDTQITILHRGIRVFGSEEELYTDALEQGIEFVEFEGHPRVSAGDQVTVEAEASDGSHLKMEGDTVVLSLAHFHGGDQNDLSRITGVPLDELGFLVSGSDLGCPFSTPVEGVFVCGFSRHPVSAGDAFTEGIAAAGAICRKLGG